MANHQLFSEIKSSIQRWYLPLIAGIVFVLTGIWSFFSPGVSYFALTLIFSFSFIASGVMEIAFAIVNQKHLDNWVLSLIFGILTAIVGGFLLANPIVSMLSLALYVGLTLMLRSIVTISWSVDLKKHGILDWGNLLASGIIGGLMSLILIFNPLIAGLTLVFWVGLALILGGAFNIYLAVRLKKLNTKLKAEEVQPAETAHS